MRRRRERRRAAAVAERQGAVAASVADASAAKGSGRPAPGTEAPSELHLVGVSLLASTDQGPVAVPGLSLRFDESGMTVNKTSGETVRNLGWSELHAFETGAPGSSGVAGEAGAGAVLRVRTADRVLRFVLIPGAESPEPALVAMARRHRGGPVEDLPAPVPPPVPSGPVPDVVPPHQARPPAPARVPFPGPPPAAALLAPDSEAGEEVLAPPPSRRRSRRGLWLVPVLVLILLAIVGLEVAQHEGAINILPKSLGGGSQTTGGTVAPRAQTTASAAVPGLMASDVITRIQPLGFSCAPRVAGRIDCTGAGGNAIVRMTTARGGISLLSVTYEGSASSPTASDLLGVVAQVPYQQAVPSQAASFVSAHTATSGRTVIGAARLSILVTPTSAVFEIAPAAAPPSPSGPATTAPTATPSTTAPTTTAPTATTAHRT